MAIVEMLMPKMGESVMEGTVLAWLKNVGETIEEDESLLEVATDKVDTEIPATYTGVLKEILVQEGDVIQVGNPIAKIEVEGDASSDAQQEESVPEKIEQAVEQAVKTVSNSENEIIKSSEGGKFYSPLVRSIAQTEGIGLSELNQISGSGTDGRVTKTDILNYLKTRKSGGSNSQKATATPTYQSVPAVINGADEIIEMDRMRKMIAERMVASKQTSPHVSSFVEADLTSVVNWRDKIKNDFKKREGESITFTPIMIEAIVKAIKDFPMINVQVDGTSIVKKRAINIGMAAALPSGNLIVPVIHNADQLSLLGLTKKVNDLARRARENKLKPDELQGGTYTVSNIGSFGNILGTPIIMQPQVAIMAVGAIQKKPAVIETSEGDMIGIRHKMYLSHSYDHRVVDGALGGMFVKRVADYLENFDTDREI